MAYDLRAKAGRFRIRDGATVRIVAGDWVSFDSLPPGMTAEGDGDIEVRVCGVAPPAKQDAGAQSATVEQAPALEFHQRRKGRKAKG